MHDSVSLDGSFVNFDFSPEMMGLHYQIAAEFGETIRLFGSNTAKVSIELFGGFTPETKEDFKKPQNKNNLLFWVVPDSKAVLMDKLHYFRRSEYCRDVIVLVAENTSQNYLEYLKARNYDYYIVGKERVDLSKAVELLAEKYKTESIMVDSGRGLTNAMLNQGLIDEISLLVLPVIVGEKSENLFKNVVGRVKLANIKEKTFPGGYIWLLYKVTR